MLIADLIPDIRERVKRLEIPFNDYGVDAYGISTRHLAQGFVVLGLLYKGYFSVECFGAEHVPARGRCMLIGNHSGGVALDGAMVIASMFFEKDPPRLAQAMIEKFIHKFPIAALWSSRTGQFTGIPEHAIRLLEDDRLLLVFPEGARGTAKLYRDRNSLVEFGTGFMRLALKTKSPIVPFAFLGGGEAIPTVFNAVSIGRMMGLPYIPVTPYGVAFPLPVRLQVYYGEPMVFEGTGNEEDHVIVGYVDRVKAKIAEMIALGAERRKGR